MQAEVGTEVINLMDGRVHVLPLAADMAVVAAYEQFEKGGYAVNAYQQPSEHPLFNEHRLGFSCGDWIAYKKGSCMTVAA
jgi:hypothetical protein